MFLRALLGILGLTCLQSFKSTYLPYRPYLDSKQNCSRDQILVLRQKAGYRAQIILPSHYAFLRVKVCMIKGTLVSKCLFTAVLHQNRSFDSVWSKIGTLQDCILLCKSAATHLPKLWFLTNNESFQMNYCMNFFFKGHQNCQKSNLKVHEKSCFIKWIWKAKTLTSGHSDAPWRKRSYSTSFESSH